MFLANELFVVWDAVPEVLGPEAHMPIDLGRLEGSILYKAG